jgi:hypothetical protein
MKVLFIGGTGLISSAVVPIGNGELVGVRLPD